jgi:hypothetical protein
MGEQRETLPMADINVDAGDLGNAGYGVLATKWCISFVKNFMEEFRSYSKNCLSLVFMQ